MTTWPCRAQGVPKPALKMTRLEAFSDGKDIHCRGDSLPCASGTQDEAAVHPAAVR
jgi:hypothetical protein